MSGTSLSGIILIVVVIVAGLGTWLALVAFAAWSDCDIVAAGKLLHRYLAMGPGTVP